MKHLIIAAAIFVAGCDEPPGAERRARASIEIFIACLVMVILYWVIRANSLLEDILDKLNNEGGAK